jgi:hypothetical protein
MMKKLAVLASVVAALAVARPALAQGPFADVPTDHWAYDAVNELAKQGIVNGYPDSTFGGKRALTRYEFAMAIQRMLQEVQRRIDAAKGGATDLSNYYTKPEIDEKLQAYAKKEDLDRLRADVDQLRRLMTEFQDTLAALGTDVDQLKRDLAALRDRLAALENEVHRMPKITGNAMAGFYGSYVTQASQNRANAAPPGAGRPTDIDNRPITSDNFWQNDKTVYDIDLGITAQLSDVGIARLLLNAGNYLGGYLNNSVSTVQDFGNGKFENVTPYYLYLETPFRTGGLGASVTVGKFGQQFTPYTLKMVDVDSYFGNEKTDFGNYPVTGGRVNFKIGGFGVQAYAGQHNTDYAPLTSTAGSLISGRLNDRLFRGNTNLAEAPGVAAAALPASSLIDQSAGVRATFHIPFHGAVGGTWVRGAGTSGKPDFRQLDVYGADLSIAPIKLFRLEGEWAQSQWRDQFGHGAGNIHAADREAWHGNLIIPIGKLELKGLYQKVGRAFDAPGSWDKIGRWFNPTSIEGYGGSASYPINHKLTAVAEGATYEIIGARSSGLDHIKAGIKYGLTSANSVDLGGEWVDWNPGTGAKGRERYYNIGFGHDFNANTSFKVLYQYIVYKAGDFPSVGPAFDYEGGVAMTQFSVRF